MGQGMHIEGKAREQELAAAAAYLHGVEKTLDLFTRLVGHLQFLYRFCPVWKLHQEIC